MEVTYTGEIYWAFGGKLSTLCELNVANFPYDTQQCSILIASWAHRATEINISAIAPETSHYHSHSIWELKKTDFDTHDLEYYHETYYLARFR